MDPAVAAFDFAKAGVIVANMIESYLAVNRAVTSGQVLRRFACLHARS